MYFLCQAKKDIEEIDIMKGRMFFIDTINFNLKELQEFDDFKIEEAFTKIPDGVNYPVFDNYPISSFTNSTDMDTDTNTSSTWTSTSTYSNDDNTTTMTVPPPFLKEGEIEFDESINIEVKELYAKGEVCYPAVITNEEPEQFTDEVWEEKIEEVAEEHSENLEKLKNEELREEDDEIMTSEEAGEFLDAVLNGDIKIVDEETNKILDTEEILDIGEELREQAVIEEKLSDEEVEGTFVEVVETELPVLPSDPIEVSIVDVAENEHQIIVDKDVIAPSSPEEEGRKLKSEDEVEKIERDENTENV